MGAQSSMFRRKDQLQLAVYAVEGLAEQEHRQGEITSDVPDTHSLRQPAVSTVDALIEQECQQMEIPSDETHGHDHQQPAVCVLDALPEQGDLQEELPSDATNGHGHRQPADFAVDALAEQERRKGEEPLDATDRNGQMTLHRVEETGDTGMQRLLAGSASVRAAYENEQTPLMVAASAGAVGLCALLVEAGAEVDARDRCRRTALHVAAEAEGDGGATVVKLLLRHGVDARAQDGCGRTALHCALQACNLAAAEVLVPATEEPLLKDDTGKTELHWAAANGTPEMVRQLAARAGGDGWAIDGAGMTPLSLALQARNREAAVAMLPVPEVRSRESGGVVDAFGRTELHWAAYAGYPEVVCHLLERDFCPWEADLCGRGALTWAVESGERRVVEAILEVAGYRECVDGHGRTALHVAAARGDAAVVARLLERGADAGRRDSEGRTPLAYALRGAHREVAFLLALRNPPNFRRPDCEERTLLHWAAVGGDADAVRVLLAHGADVNAVDAQSKTAAALAVDHGHEEAAAVLVAADGFEVVHDREGRTPLHGAAAAGWARVAERLVARGADPHEAGSDYLSPVMLAVQAGHHALARTIARARWLSG